MSDQEQGNGEGSTPEYAASKRKSPPVVTNDGTVRDELSAPEKLRIGGYMAPALRSGAKDGRTKRKVYVEGKDGSVRESTWGEVAQALSIKHGIAFEVAEKTPETTYACIVCAREFVWEKGGGVPSACPDCRDRTCDCGAPVSKGAFKAQNIAKRAGRPAKCRACEFKKRREQKRSCKCECGVEISGRLLAPFLVKKRNGASPKCKACSVKAAAKASASRRCRPVPRCGCGVELRRSVMDARPVKQRNGAPPKCRTCFLASRRKGAAQ